MIKPTLSFKENVQPLPPTDDLVRIDLVDQTGILVASIENTPGKQGSLVVYRYLQQSFDILDTKAAAHGLDVFAEHTADAKNRPGAHPNIDRLFEIVDGGAPLEIKLIET